ncbi:MAG: type II toxin-antitoxin system VapC family toxin [Phycisphaerales bacterium]
MKKRVYIETSIVSYLTARPSRDLLAAAWQEITTAWWDRRRQDFELYTSELTVEESSGGDAIAAQRRLESLQSLPLLEITDSALALAEVLVNAGAIPGNAAGDALHVALATVHRMDYLLTWNCRHIDNAEMMPAIRAVALSSGYSLPEICTPQELMGEEAETDEG